MTQAIAEREPTTPTLPKDQIDLIRRTVANGATNDELALFLYDCQRRGIHPLDKLLHFTKRGGRYTPVTSIDFMRSQAAMTGEMAGSDDPKFIQYEEDQGHPDSATVTVYRLTQGQRFAYTATARWAEYCPDNAPMWKRMPHTMLGKCAEALALRKAFPQQLAGLYAKEEMDQAGEPQNSGYTVTAPTAPPNPDASAGMVAHAEATVLPGRVVPSVSGESGQSKDSDANTYDPKLTEDWPPAPVGAVYIAKVSPGFGKVVGEITTHQGESLPLFKQELKALAEAICQERCPVYLEAKMSGTTGKPYLVGLKRATPIEKPEEPMPMSSAGDIPF